MPHDVDLGRIADAVELRRKERPEEKPEAALLAEVKGACRGLPEKVVEKIRLDVVDLINRRIEARVLERSGTSPSFRQPPPTRDRTDWISRWEADRDERRAS